MGSTEPASITLVLGNAHDGAQMHVATNLAFADIARTLETLTCKDVTAVVVAKWPHLAGLPLRAYLFGWFALGNDGDEALREGLREGVRRSAATQPRIPRLFVVAGAVEPRILFVKLLTGKTIIIGTALDATVMILKLLLQHSEAIPPSQQRLIFAGRQLEDDHTIGEYNIGNESTLHLVLSLRGGGSGAGFSFADLSDAHASTSTTSRAAASTPEWRCICNGITLHGKCSNKSCPSHVFRGKVNFPRRFGGVDVAEVMRAGRVTCPACSRPDSVVMEPDVTLSGCAFFALGAKATGEQVCKYRHVAEATAVTYNSTSGDGFEGGTTEWSSLTLFALPQKVVDVVGTTPTLETLTHTARIVHATLKKAV